jgi:SAM-dependent methyltransferase
MDLKEEDILGDAVDEHWYYQSKARALIHYVEEYRARSILDVGAGSGFFSKTLLRHTEAQEALCIDISYETEVDETIAGKTIRFRRDCKTVNADLVLMMDVLEHVDDDRGLLQSYSAKVAKDTHFLITVPAFSFLWSGHDVFLEHKRRYTLKEIENVVRDAGLTIVTGSYYFAFVFPLAASIRLSERFIGRQGDNPRSRLKKHSQLTNGILSWLCMAEIPLLRLNRLAGLTAFCLATKP